MNPEPTKQENEKIEELKQHPLFYSLTKKQQAFLIAFVNSHYQLEPSVASAYQCQSEESLRATARKLMQHWKVRKIVKHLGEYDLEGKVVTREEALQILTDRFRDPKTPTQWVMKIYEEIAMLRGWKRVSHVRADGRDHHESATSVISEDNPPENLTREEERSVNDLVLEMEARNRELSKK